MYCYFVAAFALLLIVMTVTVLLCTRSSSSKGSGFTRLNTEEYYEDDYLGIPMNGKSLFMKEYHDDPTIGIKNTSKSKLLSHEYHDSESSEEEEFAYHARSGPK